MYEEFGRNAKLLGDGEEIRLVRFEEANERGEHGRFVDAAAKLACPDSGQVDEPMSPPRVTKRCRKRGKGKCLSIDWRIRTQALQSAV